MPTDKLCVAELTSAEARDYLTDEAVLVLPMGSLEDQGIHAPMGDYLAAEAVALDMVRAARHEGLSAFMLPVIPFGTRDFFDTCHGGIALDHATMCGVLNNVLGDLLRRGLRKILIVNGHGGNVAPIREVTRKLRDSHGVIIATMYLWQISYGLLPQILDPETAKRVAGHGADPVTSVQMHYYPHLIRTDLIAPPQKGKTFFGAEIASLASVRHAGGLFQIPMDALESAPNGVPDGDPSLCSAATGRELSARLAAMGAAFLRDHVARGFAQRV